MFESLKAKMFPCTEKLNRAIAENCQASSRLIRACNVAPKFPTLKDGHIVNPR